MRQIKQYELKKELGRPFNQRTLFLDGYGISIKINDKKLVIKNDKEEMIKRIEIRNGDYNLYQERYFTEISNRHLDVDRIIISGSGFITFDALHWLTQLGISIIMLDKKGNLDGNLNYIGGNGYPLLRKKQYACFDDFNKVLSLQKWVISHKTTNQIIVLRELGIDAAWIENQLLLLPHAGKISDIEHIESNCADMYYFSLSKLDYFSKYGFKRRSRIGTTLKNEADNVINSLFNYGYTILQTIIAKQLNGIGLDCNLGFMHRPHNGFYPLIWDMVEPFRFLIDRSVIAVAKDGISKIDYSFEREELLFSYPAKAKSENRFKIWLIMKSELQKRLIKEIDVSLQREYWIKANSSTIGRKTDSGFQKMRQTTIIKDYCLELRDYILERKKSLSQPQKILSR